MPQTEPVTGIRPGLPRYEHFADERETFATRWGDFDMYFKKDMCNCHAMLIIRYGDGREPRSLMHIAMRRSDSASVRGGHWSLATIDHFSSWRDGRQQRTDRNSDEAYRIAKHAVEAYNEFKRYGTSADQYVGDALERL